MSRTGEDGGAPDKGGASRSGNDGGASRKEVAPRAEHQVSTNDDGRSSTDGCHIGLRQRLTAEVSPGDIDVGPRPLGSIPCSNPETLDRARSTKSDSIEALTQALGATPRSDLLPTRAREIARAGQNDPPASPDLPSTYSQLNGVELLKLHDPARFEEFLKQNQLPAVSSDRVCFNPLNRYTTKAQKREVLRRDGWCCATPGCPHRIFLHLHHLIPFSRGGPTIDKALLGLCTACHCNVHEGLLRIFQQSDGSLLFTDAKGNSLAKQADLELGRWLDFNIGWEGGEDDSFALRAFRGNWSVYGSSPVGTA